MRKIIFILSFSVLAIFANAQKIYITHSCHDTLDLPNNSEWLIASVQCGTKLIASGWSYLSGPSVVIPTPNVDTAFVAGLVAGKYIFQYSASNAQKQFYSGLDTVIVYPPPNKIPIAIISPVTNITLPSNTNILDGSKSFDSDGVVKTYQWLQISGPSNASIQLPQSPATTVSNLVAGTYSFRLVVTDSTGATNQAIMIFNVFPPIKQRTVIGVVFDGAKFIFTYDDKSTTTLP